jgi:hypothetical protein
LSVESFEPPDLEALREFSDEIRLVANYFFLE